MSGWRRHPDDGASARGAAGGARPRLTGLLTAAAICLTLLASACAGDGKHGAAAGAAPSPSSTASSATIAISPRDGTRSAPTQRGIVVAVKQGTIVDVHVTGTGDRVTGDLAASGAGWHSRWALNTGKRYLVAVTARDAAGRTVTATSRFTTFTPQQSLSTQIFEGYGLSYGVGMPIILNFSHPVTRRRAVERALSLWTSKPVTGAWYWDGPSTLYFRTRRYWPAHTKVRFVAHLDGVQSAPGVYGTHTLRQTFQIGRSLIAVASTSNHHIRIYLDRRLYATWPISTGKPGDDTPNGTYLTIEKQNPAHMKGPGYDLMVPWSVRITWSGDYLHDAFWSVGQQGFVNVSHGCINLSPAHAQTYYQLAVAGDPVTVGGSPRGGVWDNGWTMWFLSWKRLWHGSALRQAVKAGPDGSTFVDPASLKPLKAKPPLDTAKAGSAAAS